MAYFPITTSENKDPGTLVGRINKRVDQSISTTTTWVDKQEKYYKMRMRVRKEKTFPFKGSSNLRMPTADTYIRKVKSGVMNACFGLRPIIQAIPTPAGNPETADKVEKFLDHLIMDVMQFKNKATMIVDQSLEKGFYLAKPFWRQEICDRVVTVKDSDFEPEELQALMTLPVEQIVPLAIKRFQIDTGSVVREDNVASVIEAIMKLKAGEKKVSIKFRDVIYNSWFLPKFPLG